MLESVFQFVTVTSVHKKEFKRKMAGGGSYTPVYMVEGGFNAGKRGWFDAFSEGMVQSQIEGNV